METNKHKVQLKRWKVLIKERMDSGLKISEWCNQNNLSKHAYYYWLEQIRKEAVAGTGSNMPAIPESNSFVEIKPVMTSGMPYMPTAPKPSAVIRRNGLEVELFGDVSAALVRQLLEAVKHA